MRTTKLNSCNRLSLFNIIDMKLPESTISNCIFTLYFSRFLSTPFIFIYFILLYFFSLNTAYAALSALTSRTIQGHRPSLSATHITAINSENDFPLLGVAFDGIAYFSVSDINTGLSNAGGVGLGGLSPINLAKKLGNGVSGSMTGSYQIPLASDASDPDGDEFSAASLTGNTTVQWYYLDSGTETLLSTINANKTFCELAALTPPIVPYLKISGSVILSTEYGDPKTQIYDIADSDSPISGGNFNPTHRIYPSTDAIACYAKPNMTSNTTGNFAGPSQKWDTVNGFIPQANIDDNFPTTGANGLYFDLIISGIDATTLTWPPITSNNVTVTPVATDSTHVKITLTGPTASSLVSGATAASFSGPALFIIEGKNGSETAISYSFNIKKWFVNRGNRPGLPFGGANNHKDWCAELDSGGSYKLISVNDVTNANGLGWSGGFSGQVNSDRRLVGGGLFAEWGNMGGYNGANFLSQYYWTINNSATDGENYTISANSGKILSSYQAYNGDYGLCTQ